MGRTSTARERMIEAAGDLLRERGYAAVGVAEICATADVRKGSFYHFFESKQALTVAVVEATWEAQRPMWLDALADDVAPLARIERVLALQARTQRHEHTTSGTMFGCLFGNLALELSQDPNVSAAVSAVFEDQVGLLTAVLRDAADDGCLQSSRATEETARALLAHLEGAVLMAKVANDPAGLDRLWPASAALLGVTV